MFQDSLKLYGSTEMPFLSIDRNIRPVFQVAAQREGSVIQILNGREIESARPSVFLVEAGESRTPRPKEATQNILQA